MYYGRLVDSRILQATCALASEQSNATLGTMKRVERLLGFVSGHRLGTIVFHASDMLLSVLSDASYLSRPRARSVAGSFHYLTRVPRTGLPPDPFAFINGPVSCHTNTIPVVCSSVQEAEYAALVAAARLADNERSILHNLGYPQPPALLLCDNEIAVGLANQTITPRLSKRIDMRFHWLQDRIQRKQFRVEHVAGHNKIADFSTKALPRIKHQQFAPFCAVGSGNP
jgi:hypothetical protein